jgi:hypothetical protein
MPMTALPSVAGAAGAAAAAGGGTAGGLGGGMPMPLGGAGIQGGAGSRTGSSRFTQAGDGSDDLAEAEQLPAVPDLRQPGSASATGEDRLATPWVHGGTVPGAAPAASASSTPAGGLTDGAGPAPGSGALPAEPAATQLPGGGTTAASGLSGSASGFAGMPMATPMTTPVPAAGAAAGGSGGASGLGGVPMALGGTGLPGEAAQRGGNGSKRYGNGPDGSRDLVADADVSDAPDAQRLASTSGPADRSSGAASDGSSDGTPATPWVPLARGGRGTTVATEASTPRGLFADDDDAETEPTVAGYGHGAPVAADGSEGRMASTVPVSAKLTPDVAPTLPPLPVGVALDHASGQLLDASGQALTEDPITGLPQLNGLLLDPRTGRRVRRIEGSEFIRDPITGFLIHIRTGEFHDAVTRERLQVDRSSGFLVNPPTGTLVDPATGLHYNDNGRLVDPRSGDALEIDRHSGLPVDPITGALVDPRTGTLVDRETGEPLPRDPSSGLVVLGDLLVDPESGVRYSLRTRRRIDEDDAAEPDQAPPDAVAEGTGAAVAAGAGRRPDGA